VTLADAPATLVSASVARAASSTDRPVTGASAPSVGACSSTASTALGDGGGGFHLSWEARPRRSPLPLPLTTTNSPESPGERAPAAHAAGTPHSLAPGAPAAGSSSPSCALPTPVPVTARRGQPPGLGALAGQPVRHPLSLSAKKQPSRPRRCTARDQGGKGSLLTAGASGSMTNDQRSPRPRGTDLRLIARLVLIAAYS
jgi:hypothetical protein